MFVDQDLGLLMICGFRIFTYILLQSKLLRIFGTMILEEDVVVVVREGGTKKISNYAGGTGEGGGGGH